MSIINVKAQFREDLGVDSPGHVVIFERDHDTSKIMNTSLLNSFKSAICTRTHWHSDSRVLVTFKLSKKILWKTNLSFILLKYIDMYMFRRESPFL
jgi:hypothetical protein